MPDLINFLFQPMLYSAVIVAPLLSFFLFIFLKKKLIWLTIPICLFFDLVFLLLIFLIDSQWVAFVTVLIITQLLILSGIILIVESFLKKRKTVCYEKEPNNEG